MDQLPVALPPLDEQRRIVTKVDELMALCARLEAAQVDRDRRRNHLAIASLHHLGNGSHSEDLRRHALFYINHLPQLLTSPTQLVPLRQTILNLAVRGKLVSQADNKDDACDIIYSIKEERQRRIDAGRVKPTSPLKTIGNEIQFDYPVPPGWTFCFVDDFAIKVTDGEHATPSRSESGYYLLSARNVTNAGIDVSDVDFVPQEEYTRIRKRCDPDKGDILISCSGSVGRIAIVDRDDTYVMVRSAALIKLDASYANPNYIAYALRASPLQKQIELYSKSTAQANLFIGAIRKLRIPLPPLRQQNEIVARVDKLMSLCDALEAQLDAAQSGTRSLLEALLHDALKTA